MAKMGEGPLLRGQSEAQQSADRIRLLRQALATPELQQVLDLSPEQQRRFHEWAQAELTHLARQFDIDTSVSQKRVSWGMRELGFDTSVAPSDNSAIEFYQRQLGRRAFVALEYDGPAWRAHAERIERENARRAGLQFAPTNSLEAMSHLVAVDAGKDPTRLRFRHPDRSSVIIVPAVVGIAVEPALPPGGNLPRPAQLAGSIQEIPSSIHVPRPFSDGFRRLPKDRSKVRYRVHLRYGASYEPWIAGVEFNPPANQ
jgi:hypothetical protein